MRHLLFCKGICTLPSISLIFHLIKSLQYRKSWDSWPILLMQPPPIGPSRPMAYCSLLLTIKYLIERLSNSKQQLVNNSIIYFRKPQEQNQQILYITAVKVLTCWVLSVKSECAQVHFGWINNCYTDTLHYIYPLIYYIPTYHQILKLEILQVLYLALTNTSYYTLVWG